MRISDWSSDVCSSDLVHILGPDGEELAPGEQGEVWFETPSRFEYHGDPAKTAAAWNDKGWSSLGDVGNLDADGYLYLADRVANMIISGGVNIHPRAATGRASSRYRGGRHV